MAIFKPTMCTPTFESFSIDDGNLPIYFYCKIDSSNLQNGLKVDGYAITIYSEENEQVFPEDNKKPVDNITTISALNSINVENKENFPNLNTGINGSYLKIPFIVNEKSDGISNNQILSVSNILENGKTYKWVITLFQGAKNGTPDKDIKYYDMTLTNGQILGSYKDRIQAKYSENIYTDYFIEVGKLEGENFKKIEGTNRVRISGYDYSFGYIYPQKGTDGFKDNVIGDGTGYKTDESATHFRVYRYGSNPEDMKATNKVDICVKGIDPMYHQDGQETHPEAHIDFGNYIGSPTLSNVTVTYERKNASESDKPAWYSDSDSLTNSVIVYFDGDEDDSEGDEDDPEKIEIKINKDTRILFNIDEDSSDGVDIWKTNRNGIYYLYDFSCEKKKSDTYTDLNKLYDYSKKLVFQRTTDANTWGNLISKVVYVKDSLIAEYVGKNLQTNVFDSDGKYTSDITKMFGKINETSVYFREETPIDIYPDDNENKTIGEILYNSIDDRKIYIRPFSSIETGMKIFIPKLANVYPNGLTVKDFDKSTYGIEVEEELIGKIVLDTQYEIRTLFRSSDENNFTIAKNPSYAFHFYSVEDLKNEIILENDTLRRRNFYVRVDYEQENYISWRSYQFYLYDWTGKEISKGDKKYDGIIFEYFYGLLSGKTYSLVLSIETQDNRQYEIRKDINIEYDESKEIEGLEDAEVKFNCDTFSTVIKFEKNTVNYVLPGYDGKSVVENETNTDPVIGGVTYESSSSGEDTEYFMRVDSTLDNIITLSEDPDHPGAYNVVIKDGYQSERREFYWYDDDPAEGEAGSGTTYSVSVDGFPENGIYYDKAVPRLNETANGDKLQVGEESGNEEGIFSIHSEHTIKSQFYEGEVIGCELKKQLENQTSGDTTKISLVIPDMLKDELVTKINEREIYLKTQQNEERRYMTLLKNGSKFGEDHAMYAEMKDILPICVPDSYVKDENNFNYLKIDLYNGNNYAYAYGKYGYYYSDSSPDEENLPSYFPLSNNVQEESEGFVLSGGESFYVSTGNADEQFCVYRRSNILYTDYECSVVNNEYFGLLNMLEPKKPIYWEDYEEDGCIWRDGDSIEDIQNIEDIQSYVGAETSNLKNMKILDKSNSEREYLNGAKISLDLYIKTAGDISLESENITIQTDEEDRYIGGI